MDKEAFGRVLKKYRRASGMSLIALARVLPPDDEGKMASPQSISTWENGKHLPKTALIVQHLEDKLEVPDNLLSKHAGFVVTVPPLSSSWDDLEQVGDLGRRVSSLEKQMSEVLELVRRLPGTEPGDDGGER